MDERLRDEHGRQLWPDKTIPPPDAEEFGQWRGGTLGRSKRFCVTDKRGCADNHASTGGWVRSLDWWGSCHWCEPARPEEPTDD